MIKTAYALLAVGLFSLGNFVLIHYGSWQSVLSLGAIGSVPVLVFGSAVYFANQRFGVRRARLPAVLGATLLIALGAFWYSKALRPFLAEDKFEPNLVFIFAPQYLMLSSVVISSVMMLWAWRRHNGKRAA